ncbi:hypothetical protein [Pelagovum pacificum]|uniref:Adenylate kinase n=1 Tax=Pelagovum pacificum TaxID=2588711 RepID=A0A5C5GG15_9RHOB|nr:hypothetical protein [Pelagovum pacificum]QQA43165.1 adenylate kinase [Pelagovum pacificum]TNY33692.1 hypothetical protein FHY64_10595 [Pelagovum pacificum]
MRGIRVHITGASGSGTTTLGRALAQDWSVPCHDTDDFYWLPTDPAYTIKRDPHQRLDLMEQMFLPRPGWVLSGSLLGWGDTITPSFDIVIFMTLDPATRMDRLREREARRLGGDATFPGPVRDRYLAFLDWARRYDDPAFTGRSRATHERWLSTLSCPILRLDSRKPVDDLVKVTTRYVEAFVCPSKQGGQGSYRQKGTEDSKRQGWGQFHVESALIR